MTVIVLPQLCLVCPRGGTLLQRPLRDGDGVRPHFEACHPGMPVPVTQEEFSALANS